METLIYSSWMILLFVIPTAIISVAGLSVGKYDSVKLVGRFLISIFCYLIVTVLTFAALAYFLEKSGYRANRLMTASEQFFSLLTVYIYGLVGYLLCSFINGAFFKPWKFGLTESKKTSSVFNIK